MNGSKIMMIGFLLIFIGIQLNLVRTYTLSPSATKFWNENLEDLEDVVQVPTVGNGRITTPFSQASYGTQQNYGSVQPRMSVPTMLGGPKQITPPDWLCWPFIFIGAASAFYGLVLRR